MRKIKLSKSLLLKLYKEENLSLNQVATELGVSRQTVANKLKEYNIKIGKTKRIKKKPLKPIRPYQNKEVFQEVYSNLKSLDLLAKHFNISIDTAYRWKKIHNIKTIKEFSFKGREKLNEGKPYYDKELLERMYSKYSSYELAKMWNCNPTTILKWLKRFNIPTRTIKEQWEFKSKHGKRVITKGSFDLQKYKVAYKSNDVLSKKTRKYIIDLVGECQACGYSEVLDLHHINENHKDNRPENHAVLCPNCHAKIHRLGLTIEELCPDFISWDKIGG